MISSTPSYSEWPPLLRNSDQNSVCISHLSQMRYIPRPSYNSSLNHPNNIWWSLQVMKLLVTQSSPVSRHFHPLRSKYYSAPTFFRVAKICLDYAHCIYDDRLQSSWTHLINPSRNFVKVRWHSLFQSTSLVMRCTFYNVPPTSRKRAADRWSLLNFLPRSSSFMGGKAQKSHGERSGLYGGCSNGVLQIHFLQA
jgi:hypothetical protein